MRKSLFLYLFIVSTIAFACTQEQPSNKESSSSSSTSMTVGVTIEKASSGDNTKVDISAASGLTTWTAGDQVAYCITNGSTTQYNTSTVDESANEISLTLPDGYHLANYAIYPATAKGTNYTAPTIVYETSYDIGGKTAETYSPCPMVAINTGSDLNFMHVGGLLRLFLSNIPSGTRTLVVTFPGMTDVTGTYTVSNAGTANASCSLSSGTGNTITFTNSGANFESLICINVPLPSVDYSTLTGIKVICKDSSGSSIAKAETNASLIRIGRAKGEFIFASMRLIFGFSVSSTKKVEFAPGNLQAVIGSGPDATGYNYTASSWKFAEQQYHIIGNAEGNTTFAVGSTVDLFGWVGASATHNSYGLCTYESSSVDYYGNVAQEKLKTDWGSIPGVVYACGSGWRTPTVSEMEYVIEKRSSAMFKRGRAIVNGVYGLLLLPDNWTLPENCSFTLGFQAEAAGAINVYTLSSSGSSNAWCDMEAAGAIFFPIGASYRLGKTVNIYDSEWDSKSSYWLNESNTSGACYCYIYRNNIPSSGGGKNRYLGQKVRLIKELE